MEMENVLFAFGLTLFGFFAAAVPAVVRATDAASTGKPVFVMKMDGESLKFRLFHEDGVRLLPAKPLRAECRCSRERVEVMLQAFDADAGIALDVVAIKTEFERVREQAQNLE